MRQFDFSDTSQCSTTELILGGDWAVSRNNNASLALIARQLATRVRSRERDDLVEAAMLLERDGFGAIQLWYSATAGLRCRDHQPGPRADDPTPSLEPTK